MRASLSLPCCESSWRSSLDAPARLVVVEEAGVRGKRRGEREAAAPASALLSPAYLMSARRFCDQADSSWPGDIGFSSP